MTTSTLGRWLATQGFQVNDNAPLGRDASWDRVRFLMVHHTVGNEAESAEAGGANYVRNAPASKFPPLYQIYLGQSGRVWMCARQRSGQSEPGRASHAGEGIWPGIPRNQGNVMSLGVGVQCNGSHALRTHGSQYRVLIRLLATLCRRYGLNENQVIGHKEYSSTGKIDPRDNMNTIRADVRAELRGTTPPPEANVALTQAEIDRIAAAVWAQSITSDWTGETRAARTLLNQAHMWACAGGTGGMIPATARQRPGQPTTSKRILDSFPRNGAFELADTTDVVLDDDPDE